MKRRIPLIILAVALVGAVVYSLATYYRSRHLLLTGIVTTDDVIVSAQIQGRLQQLRVKEGDPVKTGDLLGLIQPQEWRADLAFYANSAAQSASQVDQAGADLRFQEAQTQNQIKLAEANLAAAELQLSYCTIAAPVDGEVTRKSVEVGQFVSPGQGLMAVVPLGDTWITANFKETQLAGVHPGQRAEIHVDMYGQSIEGKVDSIAGATGSRMSLLPPENATGNFVKVVQRVPVRIRIDDAAGLLLRPGMSADVTVHVN